MISDSNFLLVVRILYRKVIKVSCLDLPSPYFSIVSKIAFRFVENVSKLHFISFLYNWFLNLCLAEEIRRSESEDTFVMTHKVYPYLSTLDLDELSITPFKGISIQNKRC